MQLHDLQPASGSKKNRKRVGRGTAAGQGKTAGRGTKGQNSRAGGGVRPYFEGGQLPLVRRLPHLRGFTNIWRVEFQPVNLARLEGFAADSEVSPETLASAGIIKKATDRVAILAEGDIDRPLTVKAHRVSQAAQKKIVAAGGTVEIITV
ncbi:MAG TPA: 50S ribosomal protein L15 [Anaerolineae bacterium]|nr:50S ribosomal protein L15 [Anaerolineae bacterium]HNU04027.1 50S ribosomal protein L15 [Anaerolineae bacterium]